jgi:hypothetical protein
MIDSFGRGAVPAGSAVDWALGAGALKHDRRVVIFAARMMRTSKFLQHDGAMNRARSARVTACAVVAVVHMHLSLTHFSFRWHMTCKGQAKVMYEVFDERRDPFRTLLR